MKDFYQVFVGLIVIGVAIALFLGFVSTVRNTFKNAPKHTVDSGEMIQQQRERMKEVEERQKQFMREQKDRMRDFKYNN